MNDVTDGRKVAVHAGCHAGTRNVDALQRVRLDPDAAGTGPSVVVYSAFKRKWLAASRRWVQSVRPDTRGDFEVRGLPAGGYHVAVVEGVPAEGWDDPAFLAALTPETTLTLVEGEPLAREFIYRARARQ